LLFNADCNEQVFFLNHEKKFGADPSWRFREIASLMPKNDVTDMKARVL